MLISELIYACFIKYPSWLKGIINRNVVKVHWGRNKKNFGDCLSPYILKHYGFTPVYTQESDSQIVLAGSILQWLPKDYNGVIFGTGGDDQHYCFPKATILGLRGKRTLENLIFSNKNEIILGDPGLIVNYVFPKIEKKEFILGIVPHFVDDKHDIINKFKEKFGDEVLFIDVLRDAKYVIRDIKRCKHIASSSLHGLITADAFNIPNIRFVIRETMPSGFFDYKFDDYYSSINAKRIEMELNGKETIEDFICNTRNHMVEIKKRQLALDNVFSNLKNIL